MGASYHPTILPGSVMVSVGADGLARVRATRIMALSEASRSKAVAVCWFSLNRKTRKPSPTTTTRIRRAFPPKFFISDTLLLENSSPVVDHGIDAGNKEQCEQGRNCQSPHDGSTQRRILGICHRHREHADNHSRSGHEYRTNTALPRLDRSSQRVTVDSKPFTGVCDEQD